MSQPTSPLERRARARAARNRDREADEQLSVEDLRRALHELHVHRIELELQNEELRRAQVKLEYSRSALAVSEHRYQELFELAPVGYLRLGLTGAILEANETGADVLGSAKRQLVGLEFTDFVASRHQGAYYLHRQAVLAGELPSPVQISLCTPGGETRDVEVGARLVRGDPDEIRVVLLDVTDRARAEMGRIESERQRRLMADALPIAISYFRADGRFEFCNQEFAALFGKSPNAVEERAVFDVLDADVYGAWRDHVRDALKGRPTRFEGEVSFPKKGRRFVSAFFEPDSPSKGPVRGVYLLLDDRTSLERARSGLREAAAQAALAEERERRVLAADLHDDAGQLLSLASIKLQALHSNVVGTGLAGPVHEIVDLTREAREAISSLSFELSPPLLYDVGFVAAAEWLVDNLEKRYGLETKLSVEDPIPDLDEATRVTAFRALRELLINVAKHAGTNRATVEIRGEPDSVVVVVGDQGLGFDRGAGESGFGLRNVLDRIEALGGRVVIDSARKKGAKVSMTIPAGEGSP